MILNGTDLSAHRPFALREECYLAVVKQFMAIGQEGCSCLIS